MIEMMGVNGESDGIRVWELSLWVEKKKKGEGGGRGGSRSSLLKYIHIHTLSPTSFLFVHSLPSESE